MGWASEPPDPHRDKGREKAPLQRFEVGSEGETVILKLLTPLGIKDEAAGAVALAHVGGRGAVRLLRHDDRAHLLEYADSDDLLGMVTDGQDEQATIIIADVLNQLHRAVPESPPDGLIPLRRWFRSLFNRAASDQAAGVESIYRRAAPVATALLDHPRDLCVLHGDIHHENIRHKNGRGWLAFDPKGLYGERTYDAANTLCNPVHLPEMVANEARLLRNANILSVRLEIELSRLLTFTYVYASLSACWSLEDGGDPALALRVAEILQPHVLDHP